MVSLKFVERYFAANGVNWMRVAGNDTGGLPRLNPFIASQATQATDMFGLSVYFWTVGSKEGC